MNSECDVTTHNMAHAFPEYVIFFFLTCLVFGTTVSISTFSCALSELLNDVFFFKKNYMKLLEKSY